MVRTTRGAKRYRRRVAAASFPIALLAAALLPPKRAAAADDGWQPAGDDLEIREIAAGGASFFPAKLVFVRSSLSRLSIGVVRAADYGHLRADVKTLVKLSKAVAAVNANFFDERGNPLGLVVSRAIIHRKLHRGGKTLTGIFQAGRNGVKIVGRDQFSPNFVVEAVQAGPRLLLGGMRAPGMNDTSYSRRAGVCIDRAGRVNLFCVSSGLLGITIFQLQDALLSAGIDCVDALNFDGGGSAQLYFAGTAPGGAREILIEGSDQVPVVIGLFPKEG